MKKMTAFAALFLVFLFRSHPARPQQLDSSASANTITLASAQPASGEVTYLVRFNGVLKDRTGKAATGVVGLTCSLYELPEGGSPLWVESETVKLDEQGRYTGLLGATLPDGLPLDLFTTGKALWLGVQPQLPADGEEPRVPIELVAPAREQTVSSGRTYYVDNCVVAGSDRNNGTSASTPWLTVAHVNAQRFNPGDSILFQRTCTWREQLTPPSSGTSGNPITFGSYGTGALPIISGSALLTSWTNKSGNVWQVSLPTKPNQIFFNGTRGTEVGSEASVTSVNEWCWASDVLYVHSSSNPAKAFTSPGIEASQLSYNIQLGSQDYLTIQNLHTTESNQFGIFQYGPASGTLTQTITGNTIDRAYYDGVVLGTAGSLYTSVEIGNNAVSECGGDGIHLNAGIQSATVEHNTVFSNNLLYTSSGTDTNLKFLAGIHFNGNGTNITNLVVQYNLVYSNGPSVYKTIDAGNGIWLDTIHDPNTVVRYNLLYGNTASGIMMENANRNQALYNISYSNGEAGIWVQNSDGTATSNQAVGLYNNTVFGNSVAGILLQGDYAVASTCTRNLVKNNISSGNTGPNLVARYGCENAAIYGSGNVYTYNDFGPQAANFIEWAGGVYESTYATWETATGNCGTTGCSHSVEADPQFVNASSSQFWLASGSPAIDAGLNLGSPYNIALMPGGTWPNSIVTGDQNAYGSGWEIGAFVYLPPVVISPP